MSDRLLEAASIWLRVCGVLGVGLALAGCAAGGGWAAGAMLAFSLGALALSGCTSSHGTGEDAAVVADAGRDAGGYWEACCVDGRIDGCYCPSGWACNYGWFNDCGDGTCVDPTMTCPGEVDGGTPIDAGGTWDACCVDGTITTCFCPGGAECNYGWYTDCGDGTCVDPVSSCPDAGVPDGGVDAGGTWDPCCVDGTITTCWCPPDAVCNYWYEDCGDGTCVYPGTTCAAPSP